MHAFIDFEASSLGRHGYPIEVAWVLEDGREQAHLVRPLPTWTDWDPASEQLHGISREQLQAEGESPDVIAQALEGALAGLTVLASAPSWDGKWLSLLLRAGGLPRHTIRVTDSDAALAKLAETILLPSTPSHDMARLVRKIVAEADRTVPPANPAHRALPDARRERERWHCVHRLAAAY